MLKLYSFLAVVTVTAAAAVFLGCAQEQSPAPAAGEAAGTAAEPMADHAMHDGHGMDMAGDHAEQPAESPASGEAKGLAELSPEDRALAEKQKVCPVSGEPLGTMGKPYKVTVKGREVFLCCSGCEDKIKTDPDKYLAKLDENQ